MARENSKRAKVLTDEELSEFFKHIHATSSDPLVDIVVFLLSFRAALRVREIAGLEWKKHVLTATGKFDKRKNGAGKAVYKLTVSADIGKRSVHREITMAPDLYEALHELYMNREEGTPFVVPSRKRGSVQTVKARAHALCVRINRLYDAAGYFGATSHSGRRTLLTKASRAINNAGGNLRDVQRFAGHANIESTECYLDGSDAMDTFLGN